MEQQKEKVDLRFVVRICPSCKKEFTDADHQICPDDQSLLCPVGQDELIGKRLSQFEIVSKIGSGSSSSVYLARSVSTDLTAAIKILDSDIRADAVGRKRFEQEAEAIRSFNDPLIPQLYEFGVLPDGRPFLIMDFVDGVTLKELLDSKGRIDEQEAVELFLRILDALEVAHRHGVLHRDIKPSNIMIERGGKIKVVDFGVAKVKGLETTTTVTRTGVSLGTPAYMSPEQCMGGTVDVRSEIYSVGCLMYECLSGKKVFDSQSVFNCMHQHSFVEPRPLSEVVDGLNANLEHSVMRCLEKVPQDRFQSVDQLRAALKGETSRTPVSGGKLRAPKRIRSAILYLVPVAVMLLLVPFVYKGWLQDQQRRFYSTFGPALGQIGSFDLPPAQTVVLPEDKKSAIAQLDKEFADIERLAADLERVNPVLAQAARKMVAKCKAQIDGDFLPPATREKEIHLVCGDTGPLKERPPLYVATVKVTYTGNPIELILENTNSVQWIIERAPGVEIGDVYLRGFKPSKVTGLAEGTKVHHEEGPHSSTYGNVPRAYVHRTAERSIAGEPASVVTCQPAEPDALAVIGPESKEWRAQHMIWRLRDLYESLVTAEQAVVDKELSKISFDGLQLSSDADRDDSPKFPSILTPVGIDPVTGLRQSISSPTREYGKVNLPVFAGARGSDGKQWYLATREGVVHWDSQTSHVVSLPVPAPLPDLGFCTGITRDTRRDRILALSIDWVKNSNDVNETILYSFEPDNQSWSVLARFSKVSLDGLAYSPSDDTVYVMALRQAFDSNSDVSSIVQLSASDGKLLKVIPTSTNMVGYQSSYPGTIQLNVSDRFLIVTFSSRPHTMANWIINRHTGGVLRRPKDG